MNFNKLLLAAGVLFLPILTSAHTRWFLEGEVVPVKVVEPTALYLGVWAAFAFLLIFIGIIFHQKNILRLGFLRPKSSHAYERAASTFTMVTGAFLIIAGTHEYLFSPNLSLESGVPQILIITQVLIGLALLLGIGTRVASVTLVLVWLAASFFVGLVASVENIWVLSTAVFMAIMGNDYFSLVSSSFLRDKFRKYKSYALSFLRLGTGTALLILGFTEKILNPEFGLNFLAQHDWNFMQALGFEFSNYLFVLSAGATEAIFGLVFILGIVTRLNALIVAIVFTVPLFILGPIELAGHMPHFAAVVLLLLFGNGGHFLVFKKYQDAKVG